MPAKEGEQYRYTGKRGLGQEKRIADPGIPEERNSLASDMADLDLPPGTVVTVLGDDADRDLTLVQWTDSNGTDRILSMEPGEFGSSFKKENAGGR